MKCIEIKTEAEWVKASEGAAQAEFLQSFYWGEFQKSTGKQVIRLGVYNDQGEVVATIQGFVHALPLGFSYLYIPRAEVNADSLKALKEFAQEKKFMFVRVEPLKRIDKSSDIVEIKNRQPKDTLVLDITKPEDTLLAQMHEKTRYNIRLAQKKGVEIREGKDADVFWKLNTQTTSRDAFKSHDKSYYEKMLAMPICHQLTAYYENIPVASNLYISFNGVCTYVHGASSNEYRNVMAPYVLQWTAIQFAKKFGVQKFDFWGIAPDVSPHDENAIGLNGFFWNKDHAWGGVTRFKAGFGGMRISYPPAVEIIINSTVYKLYSLLKKWM